MCDINEGSQNWLCKTFGHKHTRWGLGWVQAVPGYCVRCFANAVTKDGDGALWCKVFGHQNRFEVVGDFDGHSYTGSACWKCHAKV